MGSSFSAGSGLLVLAGLLSSSTGAQARARDPGQERALPAAAATLRPELDHEPVLRVLLARAPRVTLRIAAETRLEASGRGFRVPVGSLTVEARGTGWRVVGNDQLHGAPGVLRSGGKPILGVDAIPRFGDSRPLRLAGDLLILSDKGEVAIVERVRMEEYLAGVVGAEMNPKWPTQALGAQAIVARSYAAARWMERHDESWHLNWHFGVDMAYHGWTDRNAQVARAIAPTRGEVLTYRGLPVLALFHASSGGRTESFERVKPGVLAPDGRTPIAAAMPVVDDAAAMPGAAGLRLQESHGLWKTDVPLPEVTQGLREWSKQAPGRPVFGQVEGVSVLERHADSGRVAKVSIRHQLDGKRRFTSLQAADFRLAVSPVRIRSLWWDRCVIAAKEPGYLVLQGRGFGHGCGLSQVSAWYLATQGIQAEAIVGRFYAGARIERKY